MIGNRRIIEAVSMGSTLGQAHRAQMLALRQAVYLRSKYRISTIFAVTWNKLYLIIIFHINYSAYSITFLGATRGERTFPTKPPGYFQYSRTH